MSSLPYTTRVETMISAWYLQNMNKGIMFYIFSFVFSWGLWGIAAFLGPEKSLSSAIMKIASFGPSVAACLYMLLTSGISDLREFVLKGLKAKASISWWLFASLCMPLLVALAYAIARLSTGLPFESALMPMLSRAPWSIPLILIYFVILSGPLGEEFGWRGFALPHLQRTMRLIPASLVLGIIWAIWHAPLFFINRTIQFALAEAYGLAVAAAGYAWYTIMLSLLISVVYLRTGGSVLLAMVFHASSNLAHGLVTILVKPAGGAAILILISLCSVTALIASNRTHHELQNDV